MNLVRAWWFVALAMLIPVSVSGSDHGAEVSGTLVVDDVTYEGFSVTTRLGTEAILQLTDPVDPSAGYRLALTVGKRADGGPGHTVAARVYSRSAARWTLVGEPVITLDGSGDASVERSNPDGTLEYRLALAVSPVQLDTDDLQAIARADCAADVVQMSGCCGAKCLDGSGRDMTCCGALQCCDCQVCCQPP